MIAPTQKQLDAFEAAYKLLSEHYPSVLIATSTDGDGMAVKWSNSRLSAIGLAVEAQRVMTQKSKIE